MVHFSGDYAVAARRQWCRFGEGSGRPVSVSCGRRIVVGKPHAVQIGLARTGSANTTSTSPGPGSATGTPCKTGGGCRSSR